MGAIREGVKQQQLVQHLTLTARSWFEPCRGVVFRTSDECDAPACVAFKGARSIVALIFRASIGLSE